MTRTDSPLVVGAVRSSPDSVLRVSNVVLGHGKAVVLRDIQLEILPGELWFFIGPNGSGKTTFLGAILGIHRITSGVITLAPELASRQMVGFVPQRCDAKATLPQTVREFVDLGLTRAGISAAERRENIAWALEMTGISDLAERDYWSVSGGQRQRALIARGLARRPSLLILDEPTSGLDIAAEESLVRLVVSLNRDLGITVVFVTHVLALALRHATHVALFHQGRITCGKRDGVLIPELLREAYGLDEQLLKRLSATSIQERELHDPRVHPVLGSLSQ